MTSVLETCEKMSISFYGDSNTIHHIVGVWSSFPRKT